MPAMQAYEPPPPFRLILATFARRYPRSGQSPANTTPKMRDAPRCPPASAATKLSIKPRRARLPLFARAGYPAPRAGCPVLGAGPCPAAVRARSPRLSQRAERSELSPWAKASSGSLHANGQTPRKPLFIPFGGAEWGLKFHLIQTLH